MSDIVEDSDIVEEVESLLEPEATSAAQEEHKSALAKVIGLSLTARSKLPVAPEDAIASSKQALQRAQKLFDLRLEDLDQSADTYTSSSVLKDQRLHPFIHCLGVCQCTLGIVLAAQGEYKSAETALRKALVWFKGLKDEKSAVGVAIELGEVCRRLGDWSAALKYLREATRGFQEAGNKSGQARALTNIGVVFWALQRYEDAVKFHRAALAFAKEDKNVRLQAQVLSNAGLVYTHVEDFKRAAKCFDTASKLSRAVADHRGEARELNNKGMLYLRAKRFASARDTFEAAHASFEELGDTDGMISTGFNLGALAERTEDYSSAEAAYDKVLQVARSNGRRDAILIAVKHLAFLFWYARDVVRSMEYSREALKLAVERKDRRSEARLQVHIGTLYARLGDHERSRRYFDKSLRVDREIGESRGQAETLMQIGAGYSDVENHRAALEYHTKSLKFIRELNDSNALASALENVAQAYRALDQLPQALEHSKAALKERRAAGDKIGEARCLAKIGSILAQSGRPEQSIEVFNAALEIQRNGDEHDSEDVLESLLGLGAALDVSGEIQTALQCYNEALARAGEVAEAARDAAVLRVHQALSEFYEQNGELAKAYEHHKNFYQAERKMRSHEQREQIKSLRVLNDLEQSEKELEIKTLRSEHKDQIEDNRQKQTFTKVTSLLKRKELLQTMQSWIEELSEAPDDELRARLDLIAERFEEIQNAEPPDADPAENFAASNDEFINKLKERYPALSATELRIAALIKVRLKVEEISRIVNLSARNVEMYHQRIRKQLRLSEAADLGETLASFDTENNAVDDESDIDQFSDV